MTSEKKGADPCERAPNTFNGPDSTVSNADFLAALFDDRKAHEYLWTCWFGASPAEATGADWRGEPTDGDVPNFRKNAYFSVAYLTRDDKGERRRRKDNFSRLPVLVLDDAAGVELAPTWKLETSPGKFQIGFKLSEPIVDAGLASRLHDAVAKLGKMTADTSGNNSVRYVRLPCQVNNKYSEPFPGRLIGWNPEIRHSLDDLIDALGLNRATIMLEAPQVDDGDDLPSPPGQDPTTPREGDGELIRQIVTGETYHDPTMVLAARYAARGMAEKAIIETLQGFMHAAPDAGSERWESRFGDVSRLVKTALEKYRKPAGEITLTPITEGELTTARLTPRVVLGDFLYADLRTRIAAGGTGKTTLALFEAATLALGRELWGRTPPRPVKTAIVTREDSREILVGRLREIVRAMGLTTQEQRDVLARVQIIDLSNEPFRVSMVADDVVIPHTANIDRLTDALEAWGVDWLIFDPLVSFGVGESRVNDAEQGLIEAFRVLRNRLDCCVEGIHHTGKANAREKALDQYAGRGGSALSDGGRMVAVLQPLTADEWTKGTGSQLATDESGMVLALPKLSYSRPQEPIFIRRLGYAFAMQAAAPHTAAETTASDADKVHAFLAEQYAQGKRLSQEDVRNLREQIGLTRARVVAACTRLKLDGRVIYHEAPKGKAGSHYEPLTLAVDDGDGSDDLSDWGNPDAKPSPI